MNEQKLKYYLNNRNFMKKKSGSKHKNSSEVLHVVNDQIVLNAEQQQPEENDTVTSYTYMRKKNAGNGKRWSVQDDNIFYASLECCGCEFSIINILFPGRSRNNLKQKYKREYRNNAIRVEDALNNFKTFDSARFMQLKEMAEKQ